jgi:hypothetical protein
MIGLNLVEKVEWVSANLFPQYANNNNKSAKGLVKDPYQEMTAETNTILKE